MSETTPTRPRRRWWWRAVAGVAGFLLLVGGGLATLGWKVVHHPTIDPVPDEPVDALMVLGPLDDWRLPEAERLMREGKARNLVLSTPNMPWDALYCQEEHDWPSFCFAPEPATTRGEALGYRALARQHGWRTVMVLTVDFHVDRSRFIFERCLRQDVIVTGQHVDRHDDQLTFQMGYQTAGFLKELWLGRCPD